MKITKGKVIVGVIVLSVILIIIFIPAILFYGGGGVYLIKESFIDRCITDADCTDPWACEDGKCVKRCYVIIREQPEDGGRAICEKSATLCGTTIKSYTTLQDCISAGGIAK